MLRTLIVGDIHGCYDELMALVDEACADRVVSVGDMVDRGPASEAVWRFFAETEGAVAILGNHEQKCMRWHHEGLRPALSQRITRKQHGEQAWMQALGWFATLPRWLELDEVTVVHGFWEPGRAVHEQHPTVITGTLTGEKRVRRLARPWYELYDGPKPLVVGHAIYDGASPLIHDDRVYGIDTGCVHGLKLTGLVVPTFEIVQVDARADHWQAQRAAHPDLRFAGVDPDKLDWSTARQVLPQLGAHPHSVDKATHLTGLLADAEAAAERLLAAVEAEHRAAEAALPDDYDARSYARAIRGSRITELLHRRRTAGFDRAQLEARWSRPAQLLRYVRSVWPDEIP